MTPTRDEISVKQAAQVSGLTRQSIYNLVRDAKIKYSKPAHEVWISKKSLLEYLANRAK